jgi:ATP-binding cassette subfamily B protein
MNKKDLYVFQKPSVLNFLLFFVRKYKINFFFISLAAIIVNVSSNTIWPYILGELVNGFAELDSIRSVEPLIPMMIWAILYWVIATAAHSVKGFLFGITRPKFCADIRRSLFELVMHHRHSYFVNKHIGSISQRIAELPKSAQLICDNFTTVFGPLVLSILLSAGAFFYVHIIPSIMFSIFLLVYVAITVVMGSRASRHCDEAYRSFAELFGCIVDSIRNHFSVRIFSGLKNEKSFIESAQRTEIKNSRRAFFFIEKLKLVLGAWEIISVTGILWVSVMLWQKGELSVGDLIFIANSIFNIMSNMWFAVDEITYTFNEVGICKQGLTLLQDENSQNIFTSQDRNNPDIKITEGKIQFQEVSFKYRDGVKLFDSKTIEIPGGERVGLVGFSGSGKTTFVHLIMKLFEVDAGKILIDDQDIKNVSAFSLRNNIAFIQQDPILFHRSIMDNIRYGRLDASDEEVIDASIKAHAHDFIVNMPDGYNSTVGEMGTKLSGGQRQRIAIARAILRNAPILIMDEATSALDSVTEKKIQESLNYLMKDKTVIVIAHRLSTVLHMDRIIVFDKGKILEQGTHEQLLKNNGHYKTLWNMQNDGMLPNEKCED